MRITGHAAGKRPMSDARTIQFAAVALVALTFGMVTTGCGVSDKNRIQAAVKTWKEGVAAKDVSKLMSIVSDKFSHDGPGYRAASSAELREYLVRSIDEGGFNGVEVNLSDSKIAIKDTEATVYPIKWKSPKSSFVLELIFTEEGAGWRLTDMAIGGERKGRPKNAAEAMAQYDENGDGKISRDEMPEFLRARATLIDANGDGSLNQEELEAAFRRMRL